MRGLLRTTNFCKRRKPKRDDIKLCHVRYVKTSANDRPHYYDVCQEKLTCTRRTQECSLIDDTTDWMRRLSRLYLLNHFMPGYRLVPPVTDRLNTRMKTDRTAEAGRSNAARLAAIPQVDNDSGQRQRQTHHHNIRQEKLACTHRY